MISGKETVMGTFGKAKYIKATKTAPGFSRFDPLPFFRREFRVDQSEVCSAELWIQAPGFCEVFINGKPVTEDKFISPISDYTKILWYHVYDVAHLLRDGVNTVGVITGNGFFNESFQSAWKFHLAAWRDAPQFMLALKINGEDALVSDATWRASFEASHIIFSHLRSGEHVDMRRKNDAWMYTGYDDHAWKYAVERDPSEVTGELRLTPCQPVRECEVLRPVSICKVESGYLVDFGKNSSGYMEITLTEPRGQEIVFRYAEEVDERGYPKHNQMDNPLYYPEAGWKFMVNRLIASGKKDIFKPKFSYHGFRYVLIEGLSRPLRAEDVRAYFVHNDIPRTSDFTSGSDVINYVYTAGIRSSLSNMFWSLTDCPTREKLGWTNDAQASCEQLLINFDIVPFFKKWYTDVLADQLDSGELHSVIPSPGYGLDWGPGCDYFLFELPTRVYLYTGDASMLTDAIPHFEKYRAFFRGAIERNYEFRLGDWLGGGNSKVIPLEFIRSVYYIKVLRALILAKRLANVFVEEDECELNAVTRAFTDTYLNADGECTVNEQTSCAVMIVLGIYRSKEILCRQLVRAVERDGVRLTSGMIGVQYLYDALSECERPDLAYRIITESEPGYKTWYEYGATTLFEKWEGVNIHSHNHHMFSNVLGWFFKSLLGIAPCEDAPGFARVRIRPQFIKDLGFVKGYVDTIRGRISAEWKYEDGGFTYTVTLPDGVLGEYMGRELTVGENTFFAKYCERNKKQIERRIKHVFHQKNYVQSRR
ncbi:MAG: hypothetical protein E7643_09420 [Ruminococcaceae bacterium]|nr:hypothetical protein [Oscillospiraceae bacterium]